MYESHMSSEMCSHRPRWRDVRKAMQTNSLCEFGSPSLRDGTFPGSAGRKMKYQVLQGLTRYFTRFITMFFTRLSAQENLGVAVSVGLTSVK